LPADEMGRHIEKGRGAALRKTFPEDKDCLKWAAFNGEKREGTTEKRREGIDSAIISQISLFLGPNMGKKYINQK